MGLRAAAGRLGRAFLGMAHSEKFRRAAAALILFVLLTVLAGVEFIPEQVNLEENQVAPRTVKAPRTVTFVDKVKTERMREEAAAKVPPQYDYDPQVGTAVQNDVESLMDDVREILTNPQLDAAQRAARLKEALPFTLPDAAVQALARSYPETLETVRQGTLRVVAEIYIRPGGITGENLAEVKQEAAKKVAGFRWAHHFTVLAQGALNHYLRPNAYYDAEKTEQLRAAARDEIPPQMVTVHKDEIIIREGDIVTAEHLAKLQALGLARPPLPFRSIAGTALLVALLMGVVYLYLRRQHREIAGNEKLLYLLALVVITVLAFSKMLVAIRVGQWPEFGDLMGYAAPLAAAGMLVAILLDPRLAVVVVAAMSILLAMMTENDFRFALVGFVGGFTGVYSVSRLSQRADLVRAGAYVAVVNAVVIFGVGLLTQASWVLTVTSSLALGIANGVLSSILTNGSLPFLEHAFGITSAVRLLELGNPGQPLLQKLLMEAPGTYHHSLIVANLAEAAAQAVGADALLARVGSYYHDIGKVKRPYFFIENQVGGENPHDKISPALSVLILTSHVKDGVEMAREHKLPEPVVEIIEQHHGTSLITFFYHKALEGDAKDSVREEDFRYDGPVPRSREAAIVMLADAVEAAVRALNDPAPGKIEGLVRKLIKEKLADGQLDESDLNFKDLDRIAGAFVRVLTGIFHSRIEYPDMKEIERRRKAHGRGRA